MNKHKVLLDGLRKQINLSYKQDRIVRQYVYCTDQIIEDLTQTLASVIAATTNMEPINEHQREKIEQVLNEGTLTLLQYSKKPQPELEEKYVK